MSLLANKLLLTLLFTGVLMGAIDIAIIGPALPAIQAEFGMNSRELAVLFNAYVFCQMIGTQLLAKLADRRGARFAYTLAVGLFAGGSLLLVIAPEPVVLYTGRAIQGFGAGGIFPVASTVIATRLSLEDRGPALGLLGTVWGLAFLVGPVLGGLLLRYSWHWLFLINLPIAVLLIAGAWRLVPAAPAAGPQPFDRAGALTMSLAVLALVIAVNNLDTAAIERSLVSPWVAPFLTAALLLALAFWQIEQRAVDPIIRPRLLRTRQILIACLAAGGIGAMQTAGVFYPAMAVAAIGVSESQAAFMLLPGVLLSTLISPIVGRLINIIGTRLIVLVSLVLATISLIIFGRAKMTVELFIIANLISGLGMAGLVGAPLRWTVLNETGPADRTAAQALLSNVTSVGRLVGAASVGAVAMSHGGGVPGYQAAFLVMAGVALLLFLLALTLKSHAAERAVAAAAGGPSNQADARQRAT